MPTMLGLVGWERPQGEADVRAEAVDRLPTPYAVALRLHDAGAPNDLIATALGIDLRSVRPLLDLAEAKLAAMQRRSAGSE